jgi:membrane-bound lytic murein transglycosylase B
MTRTSRQHDVAPGAADQPRRFSAPRPRTLAAVLLCSLLMAGTAPGSAPPGAVINAERTSAAVNGTDTPVVPDALPSPDPSEADPNGMAMTRDQSVAVTSPAAPPAAVPAVVVSTLASDGIPVIASRAYQHAADLANQRTPSCGIPWTLLAAIGRVESDHGLFAGSVLLANGLSTPRIIGIPLNGLGTGLVLDTDHGVLDGDPVFDHAVGPMQFIPSTWAFYATDGNGDGVADPFNIDDAAAAAAKYLCNAGTDLRTRAGKVRAVLTYNHSDSYVASVLALESTYAGMPIRVETTLFTPVVSAPLPPVNPGVPPAIYPTPLQPVPAHQSPSPTTTGPAQSPPTVTPTSTPTGTPTPTPTDTPTTTPTPTTTTPTPTPTCTTPAPAPTDALSGTLTDVQKTTLAAVMEEQQLANDLYLAFANAYPTSVFGCIGSEATGQLTETRNILNAYAVADPTAGQPVGKFTSASTQQQYDSLLAQGAASVDTAYAAARTVESTTITDLQAAATDASAPDVLQLYANLLGDSRRHLAAFGG